MVAVVRHLSQVQQCAAPGSTTALAVEAFLADLAHAGDLRLLVAAVPERLAHMEPEHLRALFAGHAQHAPTTRARRQAAVASGYGPPGRQCLHSPAGAERGSSLVTPRDVPRSARRAVS